MIRTGYTWVALALMVALVTGGYAHAVVPHDEGDHHSQKEIVWGSLHSAITHEDKKSVALLAALLLFVIGLVAVRQLPGYAPAFVPSISGYKEELRRGTAAYRRFG